MPGIIRKTTVHIFGAQKQNAGFCETGFTGRTDFIVVGYLVANNYLPTSSHSFTTPRVVRLSVMSPAGLGIENYCAGEDQQQFNRPTDHHLSISFVT
jgi:hypothetical protein